MNLKGEKCVLRPWRKGDEKSLQENADNKKIWDNLIDAFPHPYTLKDAEEWIASCEKDEQKSKTHFAIEIGNEAVGGISFSYKQPSMTGTIGYWLGEKHWGKGIMTEALKLMTDYAFNEFNIKKMTAKVYPWNMASARVLEKAGYKYERTDKASTKKDGKIIDEIIYLRTN